MRKMDPWEGSLFCAVTASEAAGPALGMGVGGSILRSLWVLGERVGCSRRQLVGSQEMEPSHMVPGHPQMDPQSGVKGRQVFITQHRWPPWSPRWAPGLSHLGTEASRTGGVLGPLPQLHLAHHTLSEGPASGAVTGVSTHPCAPKHLRAPM